MNANAYKVKCYYLKDARQDYFHRPHFVYGGRVRTSQDWAFASLRHQDHEWMLIRSGVVKCRINADKFIGRAGVFYFTQPGQCHHEIRLSGLVDYSHIRFTLLNDVGKPLLFFPAPGSPARQRLRDSTGQFAKFFDRVFSEVAAKRPGHSEIIDAMILQQIWLLRRELGLIPDPPVGQATYGRQNEIVEQAKEYIHSNFRRKIIIRELADYCCVSTTHFEHIFKRIEGVSPLRYILSRKIEESKRLLTNPLLTVYMVADQVGFGDVTTFCRHFKSLTGSAPTAFREMQCSAKV